LFNLGIFIYLTKIKNELFTMLTCIEYNKYVSKWIVEIIKWYMDIFESIIAK
jgi:hypothetical protein